MDVQYLIGEIAKKHGLLLGKQDPTFAILSLNELVLAEYVERCKAAVEHAQDQTAAGVAQQVQLAKQIAERLITGAGMYMSEHLKVASKTIQADLVKAVSAELEASRASARNAKSAVYWAWAATALTMALSFWIWWSSRI